MLGALFGDMVGSPYEGHAKRLKSQEFPLFCEQSRFTDDTVMTIAVAQGLMRAVREDLPIAQCVTVAMQELGRAYPDAGYGGKFFEWLFADDPKPYGSWGNGSAMRVSPVGWLFDDMQTVERAAQQTAVPTHDHPDAVAGAQAVAACVFMARKGDSKYLIKDHTSKTYGYDLDTPLDVIRPTYRFDSSCAGSVPQAIRAFLESRGFEDAARKAVSLGGDSDTQACMACAIGEAYYGIPAELQRATMRLLDQRLRQIVEEWLSSLWELQAHARLLGRLPGER